MWYATELVAIFGTQRVSNAKSDDRRRGILSAIDKNVQARCRTISEGNDTGIVRLIKTRHEQHSTFTPDPRATGFPFFDDAATELQAMSR